MKRQAASVALLYMTALLGAAVFTGCERQTLSPNREPATAVSTATGNETSADSVSARAAASSTQDTAAKDTMHISSTEDLHSGISQEAPSVAAAASAGGGMPAGKAEATQQPAAAKPKVDAKDAYKEEKPTLLGLSLRAGKDDVLAKFGNAKNNFVMDDVTDPISVYEYTDFSIGFNKENKLEFVDVHSGDIDPGLHGLRLGQKTEDAVGALGKPDTNSSYVLTYKSQGTVLKLDLDPRSGTIRSIKLFASK